METLYERVVFLGDIHAPFHDQNAIDVALKFIKDFKPKTIFLMGDIVDFYAISRFLKDPIRALGLQEELDQANTVLVKIRKACPDSKIYFIRGNHEYRLQKYLWSNAKELVGLHALELPQLLSLKSLGIEYVQEGRMKYHGLLVKHGSVVRKFASYTAKAEFEKNGCSGISGHTHRQGMYFQTNEGGEYKWLEVGCLCHKDADYLEGEVANWQTGLAIGYLKRGSRRFILELVSYINGKILYGGKEYYLEDNKATALKK